jgi:hypothetical protein
MPCPMRTTLFMTVHRTGLFVTQKDRLNDDLLTFILEGALVTNSSAADSPLKFRF